MSASVDRVRYGLVGAAGIVVGAVLLLQIGSRAADSGNYTFSSMSVDTPGEGVARVSYTVHWSSEEFPGTHRCRTTVFGEDGAIIGTSEGPTVALQSGLQAWALLPVDGHPADARIECNPERLDRGPFGYSFTDVRLEAGSSTRAVPNVAFDIVFDAAWEGSGTPGAARCDVVVTAANGEVVFGQSRDLVLMSGAEEDLRIRVTPDELRSPVQAEDLARASVEFGNCR